MTDQLFQRHVERLVTVHGLLEHQAVPRHDGLLSIQISDIPPVIFDICLRKRRPRTRGRGRRSRQEMRLRGWEPGGNLPMSDSVV